MKTWSRKWFLWLGLVATALVGLNGMIFRADIYETIAGILTVLFWTTIYTIYLSRPRMKELFT